MKFIQLKKRVYIKKSLYKSLVKVVRNIFHFGSLGRASEPTPLPNQEIDVIQLEKTLSGNEGETITPRQLDELLSARSSPR